MSRFLRSAPWAGVDGQVVGSIDDILADQDQPAPGGEIVDGAAVVAGVDDGGGVGREPAQVLRYGEAGIDRLSGLEKGLERDGRRLLSRGDQLGRRLVDLLMQRVVEMIGLQEARHAVVRLVVDEHGAQQRLLCFKVVRCHAVGGSLKRALGICSRILARSLVACFRALTDARATAVETWFCRGTYGRPPFARDGLLFSAANATREKTPAQSAVLS